MKKFIIHSILIRIPDRSELGQMFKTMTSERRLHRILTVNPEYLVEAYRNPIYRKTLSTADLAVPDGAGIIFAARLFGIRVSPSDRLTGVTVTEALLRFAEQENLKVGILLKRNGLTSAETLMMTLQKRYPRLSVNCFREPIEPQALADASPTILFTTLGSPAQDLWIESQGIKIPSLAIGIGVGGTFDFISGTIQRAPGLLQKIGMEWLWRLCLKPQRLPRIARAILVFPFLILTGRIEVKPSHE